MRERGEEVRVDDTPEVLSKRLASYRAQTEPLVHYYSEKRKLITVDGMMTIEQVTAAINRVLAALEADGCWPTLDAVFTGYFPSAQSVAVAAQAISRIKAASADAIQFHIIQPQVV